MKLKRWWRWALGVVVGLPVVAISSGWAASEMIFRARSDIAPPALVAASDPEVVARGRYLADIYGCSGCHEPDLAGSEFADEPHVVTMYTSNLTRRLPDYSDGEIARAVREGIRRDGRVLWGMPSESWIDVTDAEMADLIAYLRSRPPTGEDHPPIRLGPLGRIGILMSEFHSAPHYVEEARGMPAWDGGAAFARGRHIARTVCSECHGTDLRGRPDETPDLTIAAAYDPAAFARLMKTGLPPDGRDLGLMAEVAKGRFSHLTDADVAALHAYLRARSEGLSGA